MARKVISAGLSQTDLAVEVYPLRLQLLVMPKGDRSTIRISKKVQCKDTSWQFPLYLSMAASVARYLMHVLILLT